ncbi:MULTISPECIES: hypothetical protein [unclassified Streptomyces]|uniref:hypothetical protein n=1 Tax=unclassified Streptomyces TaxID=2593676 RepID=UPI0035D9861A
MKGLAWVRHHKGTRPCTRHEITDDRPGLHTLAAGIDRDRDAVIAGLTLPWSSGVVEGHGNRIKMLKRRMFSRAGFHLLRKRVVPLSHSRTTDFTTCEENQRHE